jgi:hypothetical protein
LHWFVRYSKTALKIFLANAFISLFDTQTMHIGSICTQQHCYDLYPYKPYTLAGFESGSSVPEANAMSTAPRYDILQNAARAVKTA